MTTLSFVGAGSLGQSFAGLLAAHGQSVVLLATPASCERLQLAGAIRLRGVVELDVPVRSIPGEAGTVAVIDDAHDIPDGAGVIFTTKGFHLPRAAAGVHAAWPRHGDDREWVAGVQNGIVKDDLLRTEFEGRRVVGAVTILGARREPSGEVTISSLGMTYLGELAGGTSPRVNAAADLLQQAGIPTEANSEIQRVLWSKACNAVGVFGVSVLTRGSAPSLQRNPDLLRAYLSLVRETAALAAAFGVQVGDYAGFPIRTYVKRSDEDTLAAVLARQPASPSQTQGPEGMPSMTQDLLAGRPMEADEVFSDLVARAAQVGVPVPRIALVRDLICGLNRRQ